MYDVPPSTVMNVNMSVLFAVLVNVGAVPAGHNTDAGHVTDKAVPLAFNSRVRLPAVPLAGGLLMVNVVMFAFSATGPNMFPFAIFNVKFPLDIVGIVADSL